MARHLGLTDDDELRSVLTGFRVVEGHRSLEELRSQINLKAQVVRMLAYGDATSDFRYDELARRLKARGLNRLTRETLEQLCRDEGLFAPRQISEDPFLSIAVRSFLGPDDFRQRYLRDDLDWQVDIRPRVEAFLRERVTKSSGRVRLILDAHASIAFLAGAILDLKSGVATELVQKGRVESHIWRADDGTASSGSAFDTIVHDLGSGGLEIAVAVSVSKATETHARAYVSAQLPGVGRLVSFVLPDGPGQQNVAGGAHAAAPTEQIANELRSLKATDPDATVHIFACPNSILFYLGQQHQAIAPCIVYEFDFDRRGTKSYQPSFVID
jgi:SMODS-associated and fused to various effectors sensor domain